MAEIICYANGKYNVYGTISDGFYFTRGLSIDELKQYISEEYGNDGLFALQNRLDRAHKNGHSGIHQESLEDFLCCNRAGDNEERLSYSECLERFFN